MKKILFVLLLFCSLPLFSKKFPMDTRKIISFPAEMDPEKKFSYTSYAYDGHTLFHVKEDLAPILETKIARARSNGCFLTRRGERVYYDRKGQLSDFKDNEKNPEIERDPERFITKNIEASHCSLSEISLHSHRPACGWPFSKLSFYLTVGRSSPVKIRQELYEQVNRLSREAYNRDKKLAIDEYLLNRYIRLKGKRQRQRVFSCGIVWVSDRDDPEVKAEKARKRSQSLPLVIPQATAVAVPVESSIRSQSLPATYTAVLTKTV